LTRVKWLPFSPASGPPEGHRDGGESQLCPQATGLARLPAHREVRAVRADLSAG